MNLRSCLISSMLFTLATTATTSSLFRASLAAATKPTTSRFLFSTGSHRISRHALKTTNLAAAASSTTAAGRTMSTSTTTDLSYQAWQVTKNEEDGNFVGKETTLSTKDLPNSEDGVLIQVTHSSLNYKDALSASGNKGVTRKFPHTPGIDAVGVRADTNEACLVTGYDLGMNTSGGFGEYIRVPQNWIVSPLPPAFAEQPSKAMVYGTAGLTAGLCVQKLLRMGASPSQGKVVVTGASGAVGSVAVELLSKLGFEVVAVSGKASQKEALLKLGATEVVGRETLEATKKTLLKPQFANAVDTVGGPPLVELLKQIQPGGSVACCGLVAGANLDSSTVLPFILRGVNLLGVDSVEIALHDKQDVWNKLATEEWSCPQTEASAVEIGRHQLDSYLKAFLKGESIGKIVLNHSLTTQQEEGNNKSNL